MKQCFEEIKECGLCSRFEFTQGDEKGTAIRDKTLASWEIQQKQRNNVSDIWKKIKLQRYWKREIRSRVCFI